MKKKGESENCKQNRSYTFRKAEKERIEKKIKDHDEEKLKNTRILQANVDEKTEQIAAYMRKLEDLE